MQAALVLAAYWDHMEAMQSSWGRGPKTAFALPPLASVALGDSDTRPLSALGVDEIALSYPYYTYDYDIFDLNDADLDVRAQMVLLDRTLSAQDKMSVQSDKPENVLTRSNQQSKPSRETGAAVRTWGGASSIPGNALYMLEPVGPGSPGSTGSPAAVGSLGGEGSAGFPLFGLTSTKTVSAG